VAAAAIARAAERAVCRQGRGGRGCLAACCGMRAPQRVAAAPSLLCLALAASPALLAGRAGALVRCERGVRRRRSRRHARRSACGAARAPPCGAAKLARTCVPQRLQGAAWWASSRPPFALLSHALTGGAGLGLRGAAMQSHMWVLH